MKHSLESCQASANRFNTKNDWKRGDNSAYQAARHNGWYEQCCAHMVAGKAGPKFGQRTYTTEQWVEKALVKHGDIYDYSQVEYTNSYGKVKIGCPTHGLFEQAASSHLLGIGCPKCGLEKQVRARTNDVGRFVEKSRNVHGDRYDYSKVVYGGIKRPVEIICPEHGSFWQTANDHLHSGAGCPRCNGGVKQTVEEFVLKARAFHGDRYDYSRVAYLSCLVDVEIICPEHGSFWQTPSQHLVSNCPKCANIGPSIGETELFEFIRSFCPDAEQSVVGLLEGNHELDIVVPSMQLAFEFNGLIWHSSKFGKDLGYHQRKSDAAKKAGYRLIHIWEDEWKHNRKVIEQYIRRTLNQPARRINARDCEVIETTAAEQRNFLEHNHLQGFRGGECRALIFENEVVAVAVVCINQNGDQELMRWCVRGDVIVVGGFSKVLSRFSGRIISFCDTTKFDGRGYLAAGWVPIGETKPTLYYTNGSQRADRRNFQKHKLLNLPGAIGNTEKELAASLGFYQIGGCKQLKFEYNPR